MPYKLLSYFLSLLISLLLSGCPAVGPDYARPETPVGDEFANKSAPFSALSQTDIAWWKQFDDDKLNRIITLTLAHNYDLKAALANIREARAQYVEAALDFLPTVTSHANYTMQQRSYSSLGSSKGIAPTNLNLYNTGFDMAWELDIFGRIRRNVESRDADIEVVEAQARDVMVSVIGEAARNYFELRGYQNQLAVAQKNAENQAKTFEITQLMLEGGRGTELDTSRAEAQMKTTQAIVPPLDTAIRKAIHRLSILTGQLPDALTEQLAVPQAIPRHPDVLNIGNPTELLRRRPDIQAAERTLASSTARVGVAVADLFPRLFFNGVMSLEAGALMGLGSAGSTAYSLGPSLRWEFLNIGRVHARIVGAEAHAEANLARYQQVVLNALEETENALVNYRNLRIRMEQLKLAASDSLEATELARLRYREGVSDFLNLLDAERRLLEDQDRLANSQTSAAAALATLYKALGGGWEVDEKAIKEYDHL
ncbi:efflux transporter outer membrane subunit [Candidatus Methylospira mobilis]|uniref:efflux transporter outer membrane subunit n=1 Tax=Candidatus Methylospira mobilis TaxID=1808979 RepID=UPI001D17CE69|nr:efflux transporter outer membrane subunit [Candidatus Methylospira mobilis]WNV05728.1 efflux transporter outer membrane subunit [Candidatus Methylospira mobilis]